MNTLALPETPNTGCNVCFETKRQ